MAHPTLYLAGGLQSGCTANSTGVQYKSSIICANPAFFLSVFLSVRFYHNTKQCDLHYLFIHSGRLTHNIRLFAKIIVQQLSSVDTDIYLCWRKGDLKKDLHFPENHIYYRYTDIFTSSESFLIMHGLWPWYWRIAELSSRNVTGKRRVAYGREERNYCI